MDGWLIHFLTTRRLQFHQMMIVTSDISMSPFIHQHAINIINHTASSLLYVLYGTLHILCAFHWRERINCLIEITRVMRFVSSPIFSSFPIGIIIHPIITKSNTWSCLPIKQSTTDYCFKAVKVFDLSSSFIYYWNQYPSQLQDFVGSKSLFVNS